MSGEKRVSLPEYTLGAYDFAMWHFLTMTPNKADTGRLFPVPREEEPQPMIDVTTKKPFHVETSTAGPYMRLPFSQLDDIRQLIDRHRISDWVSENILSWNGGPEYATIYFDHGGNAITVQADLGQRQLNMERTMPLATDIGALCNVPWQT